jgi:hypothetical protein
MPHPAIATAVSTAGAIWESLVMSIWRVGKVLPCSDDLPTV